MDTVRRFIDWINIRDDIIRSKQKYAFRPTLTSTFLFSPCDYP